MKKVVLVITMTTLSTASLIAQNNSNPWPTTGNVGIGTTSPNFHLQLHGTTDYIESNKFGGTANFGVTSRLGFTNTTTGTTANDGLLMRMSQTSFVIDNKENGAITIQTGSSSLSTASTSIRAITSKVVMGQGGSDDNTACVNILKSNDNGLYIRTLSSGYAGISTRSYALTDNAIQVMGTTGTTRNFAVKANGEVYARKYTTTLADIPDYVFDPSYKLMDFAQLRQYIHLNHHLPNVPSAKEYEANGVDLGEMNRVLLEKVEELTLYILQLEERLETVEKQQ